jgi:hypothetical protein
MPSGSSRKNSRSSSTGEKLNRVYCGYANGVLAYAREIAVRIEPY